MKGTPPARPPPATAPGPAHGKGGLRLAHARGRAVLGWSNLFGKVVYSPCVPHAAGLCAASLGSVPRKTHGRTACAALAQPSHGAEHLPTRTWDSQRVASFSCGSVGADHQGPREQCPCQHGRTMGPCMGALRLSPLLPGAASSAPGWWVWGCLCGCPAAGTS